ncbi:uncharacterized protein PGTG_08564 [Puccinia graminis f. sp. tritici CRL 75-36-700-3]|uniref:Uncharacterized protein n=1 Tax=Puccinia graminis f. sp. tritici (strain CRL 75-36-700-3 / race SCCL) TaxID=418459 RepID=E3KGF3_PUCGT|nr:uncharacterized protein PGTG_08564 [Puccinia graminis f. sp. tritici CRL 75-36-700-3]EFP83378.2 hypothetical protein PGTG_08564 [Puccinia graminis f. sp. tritici CRL 75-36-700-3]
MKQVSQCTGMESSQEATQIVEMRKIGAVHQLHDCSPSSPLFHPNPPGGSSSSPGSQKHFKSHDTRLELKIKRREPYWRVGCIAEFTTRLLLDLPV